MQVKSKFFVLLIPLFIFIFAIYGTIKSSKYEEELNREGKTTIGKLDSILKYPKRSYICISYYINNKKYNSLESGLHKKISDKDIGKFFSIKYLDKSPQMIRGMYSKQITDTVAIVRAGFKKEDIMK